MDTAIETFEKYQKQGKTFLHYPGQCPVPIAGLVGVSDLVYKATESIGVTFESTNGEYKICFFTQCFNATTNYLSHVWFFDTSIERDKVFNKLIDLFAIRITID
jgi:hypothetical protein